MGGEILKKIVYLCVILLSVILISGCTDENKESKINSPAQTVFEMNFNAVSDETINDNFKDLFDELGDDDFIRNKYELIKQIQTDKVLTSTLALVQYENNKSVLVQLRHDTDTGEYIIYNVIEVLGEVATFFNENF